MTHAAARFVRRAPAPAQDLPDSLHPVLRNLYLARGATRRADIDLGMAALLPPNGLRDLDRAADLLVAAIREQQRLLIVADFDADGATSCALAVRALKAFGAGSVEFLVPNRFEYGYGLTPEIVSLAVARHPHVLITVDNGVSSHSGVAAARAAGIDVIVTDHHLPGDSLPDANAIVNPNQPDDDFPSKNLAGVGVIFYVMAALRTRLRDLDWFRTRGIPEPNLAQWLDLVALGTIADVVPLDRNNRILVAQGLKRINRKQSCPGIQALLSVAGRYAGTLGASDLGFAIAPRLNAAGRLTDMSLGIECLLADNPARALELAQQLGRLNRERRRMEADMQAQAIAVLDRLVLEDGGLPDGVCLFDGEWHQGIIGILAARIRERVHRPVIAFAPSNGEEIKGSARSVPGIHIRDVLDSVAARHPALLSKFGGHAMAAGLTLSRKNLPAFQCAFSEEVRRCLGEKELSGHLETDGELAPGELTLDVARLVRDGGPWGQGFPEPLFEGCFDVVERRAVAEKHLKLSLRVSPGQRPVEAIAFRALEHRTLPDWRKVRAAYRLDINEYLGRQTLQLVLEYVEEFGDAAARR